MKRKQKNIRITITGDNRGAMSTIADLMKTKLDPFFKEVKINDQVGLKTNHYSNNTTNVLIHVRDQKWPPF